MKPAVPSVLEAIVAQTRARLAASPADAGLVEAALAEAPPLRDVLAALTAPGPRVIAEFKRRSPARGALADDADPATIASVYEAAGAAAVSVLTEPERFLGSFVDLRRASRAVRIPTLCKDFVIDPRQVALARIHGASLVLLIAAALDDRTLRHLREGVERLGMHALVEAHDATEVQRALDCGATIVGVNSRNLHTLKTDLAVAEFLRPAIPAGVIAVAESGIETPDDLARLARAGYDAFLIGASLMTHPDPAQHLAALLAAGVAARAGAG
jgi:indole-3-glycerol phosphate synthase